MIKPNIAFPIPRITASCISTSSTIRCDDITVCGGETTAVVPEGLLNENGEVVLRESDFEESFVKGTGPGGSKVNKTKNCVVLRHGTSGIVIHCHETRDLHDNRKRARVRLLEKLKQVYTPMESDNNKKMVSSRKRREKAEKTKLSKEEAKKNRINLDFTDHPL